jgi:hypothetical protein
VAGLVVQRQACPQKNPTDVYVVPNIAALHSDDRNTEHTFQDLNRNRSLLLGDSAELVKPLAQVLRTRTALPDGLRPASVLLSDSTGSRNNVSRDLVHKAVQARSFLDGSDHGLRVRSNPGGIEVTQAFP